jgi:hypothetical protein
MSIKSRRDWSNDEEKCLHRMADGLFSMLMSVKGLTPKIRYDEGSYIC